jgi:hypothetical protein
MRLLVITEPDHRPWPAVKIYKRGRALRVSENPGLALGFALRPGGEAPVRQNWSRTMSVAT